MRIAYAATCDECGFTTRNERRSYVDRAMRVHSCEKWREKLAGQARRAARMAAVDRTPKPCHHKQADHQHGTRACYALDKCRCLPCAEANAESERGRERQKAYGRYDKYVSAAQARAHVLSLTAQGMGWKRIADAADVSHGGMWKLLYGKRGRDGELRPTKRVTRETHDKLMAVELDLADGAKTASVGASRRLQALVALGWSQAKLGSRLGILPTNIGPLVHGTTATTVAHDKAIRALYDELSMTMPPQNEWRDKIAAARARNYAKANGWLPPLAWDDEQLDDPGYRPTISRDRGLANEEVLDEAAIYRRSHGDRDVRLFKAEAAELVRRWATSGRSLAECERVTGIKVDRFYRLKDQGGAA